MSRGLWFVAGAATGVYAFVKGRRTAQEFTPDGVGARVAALRAGAAVFADSVAKGMAEREADLSLQLEQGAPQLPRLIGASPSRRRSSDSATTPSTTEFEGNADGHR